MARGRVLIVDDEAGIRFGMRDFLESKDFEVEETDTCAGALEACRRVRPDVAVVDYKLPDGDALTLLPQLFDVQAGLPVVVLTAHGSIDLAVRAIKEGAEQFLTKPIEMPALLVLLERLMDYQRSRRRQLAGQSRQDRESPDPFVGTSGAIQRLAADAARVAQADAPALLLGETGSGKGVLARWLHAVGPRRDEAFVDVNCAGLSTALLDSELFGHEKGAFTGAAGAKAGLLEVAHRGTLFLDEIGDMDLQVQGKLLKVLEEQQFRRVGDVRDRRVDVRLIAATHQDPAEAVRDRRFRQDLYFRISALPLRVPPLRERREDIPALAERLLRQLGSDVGRQEVTLAKEAEESLRSYAWPGNIRELRNVLERALLLSDGPVLTRAQLRFEAGPAAAAPAAVADEDGSLTLRDLEKRYIERILREEGGHVEMAARRLGVPRSSLYQKLKAHGIDKSKF